MIKVCKIQKDLNICLIFQNRPLTNSRDFVFRDYQFQILNLCLLELPLFQTKEQFMLFQNFQDSPDQSHMLLYYSSEDEDVVQVYTFYYEVMEDVVHHSLKDSQTVSHSEKHYHEFKKSIVSPEGCFLLVSRFNTYIVEIPANICENNWNRASRRILRHNYTLEYITTYLLGKLSENRIRLLEE